MAVTIFIEQILNGLLLGSFYVLIALGVSLIFGFAGIVNFAHGVFFTLGAYISVTVGARFGFWAGLLVAPLAVGLLGIPFERLLRRFYNRDPMVSLMLTFGLAMIIEQFIRMVFGSTPLTAHFPEALRGAVTLGDFIYSRYRLAMFLLVVVCVGLVWVLLNRTPFGDVVKAGTQNRHMVEALGIRLDPYLAGIVVIALALAGLAGAVMAPILTVQPTMGFEMIIIAFVVVVVGGLGSFWGVILAAAMVGAMRGMTVVFFPGLSELSMYALMFVILLLRPRGLMGQRIERLE